MRAITVTRLGGPEVLYYAEVAEPVPEPNQVLLDIRAASVNYADIKARKGVYHLAKPLPFIPGNDCAGVVLQVGREVKSIKVGERVIAFPASGSYAEKAVAESSLTFPIPDALSFPEAAALPVAGGAAMHMLTAVAQLQPGERVLIRGASGGVGSIAVQIARKIGAAAVAATSGRPDKYPFLSSIGVDIILNPGEEDFQQKALAASNGHGFDVILNPFGGSTVSDDLECLAPHGRLLIYGELSGGLIDFSSEMLYNLNRHLLGFSFGHLRKTRPDLVGSTIEKVIKFCLAGNIKCRIQRMMPLQEAAAGQIELEERRVEGKIVLFPGS